jgi:hypothetical protein
MSGAVTWLALALAASPVAYRYRSPDGVEHFVGSLADVPAAQRSAAKAVEVSGAPSGSDLGNSLFASARQAAEQLELSQRSTLVSKIVPWLPSLPVAVVAALGLAILAWALHGLQHGRYADTPTLWKAARAATWAAGAAIALVVAEVVLTQLPSWRASAAHYGQMDPFAPKPRTAGLRR